MGDLSAHFSRSEFRDRITGEVVVSPHLVDHLERLRALTGRPIVIRSAYRTQATNRKVGGARDSQHLYGRAADLPEGTATLEQARNAGFTGIGVSGRWATHVDVRPGKRVEWRYR